MTQKQNPPVSEKPINRITPCQRLRQYLRHPGSFALFLLVCLSALLCAAVLIYLMIYIVANGVPNLTPELFSWEWNSENQSMVPALVNTVIMVLLTLLMAVPIGIFAAIYLVEYAKRGSRAVAVIRLTAETLAGIPSIVYGLFGYILFVLTLKWGFSLLAGAITLAIMVLPTIIRTTEEALMAVSDTYREGSFGLGAGRVRTVFRVVLPSAVPGILAGVILAIGRIVGESAALIFTSGSAAAVPGGPFDSARTLSVHMYCLMNEGLYTKQAYATAFVLLVLVVGINALSAFLAKRVQSK